MRVTSGSHFARAYKNGSRARGDVVTVVVVANGTDVTRLGLSVGRKVWRSAVRRNRVRRVFREAFRLSYPELPVGVDVIMIGAPAAEPALEATRKELVRLVDKAHARYVQKCGEAS